MIIEARGDTITLRGAVKSNIWPAIQAAAALLLENHPTGIIIDCSTITEYTPKGAETFADAFEYISSRNAKIVVSGVSPELLEITRSVPGVRSQVPVATTVEEARASLELVELKPRRGKALKAAVVPMIGRWRRAVYLATRLAMGENIEIHLVDLIRVPRTLPIGTPLPDREAAGQARLEEAKNMVKNAGLAGFIHFERVRSETTGLYDFAQRLGANSTVISVDRGEEGAPFIDESDALSTFEGATFEVALAKGAPADAVKPIGESAIPAAGAWEHAVDYTCRLSPGNGIETTVVCFIQVPRSEPLDASKPDAEAAAEDCVKRAQNIGKRHSVKINPRVERVRDPVIGFRRMVEAGKFELVVIGAGREIAGDYPVAHAIATYMLQNTPCEVIYLHTGRQ